MGTTLLDGDISYTSLNSGLKTKFGSFGLGYIGGASSSIPQTTRDSNNRIIETGTTYDYSNSVTSLSYGKAINEKLSMGATLKSINKSFTNLAQGTGFETDLGLIYKAKDNLRVGLMLEDVLPESLVWTTGLKEDIPMSIKGGIEYQLKDNLLILADIDTAPSAIHSGIEWKMTPTLCLRSGIESLQSNAASIVNVTFGLGFNYDGVSFDYAYVKDGILDSNSSHYFSITIAPEVKKVEAKKKKADEAKIFEPKKPAVQVKLVVDEKTYIPFTKKGTRKAVIAKKATINSKTKIARVQ